MTIQICFTKNLHYFTFDPVTEAIIRIDLIEINHKINLVMKKSILIICSALVILSLMAFSFINWSDSESDKLETSVNEEVATNVKAKEKIEKRIFSDFIYDVGTRFSPIKKADLDKATSITDFLSEDQIQRITLYKSVEVIIIENDRESDIREFGSSDKLNTAQLNLLQSSDYSTNLKIRTDFQEKNKETGELEDGYSTPHLTIVPEKQAVYVSGKDALMDFLKENGKEVVRANNVQEDKLQPAKLFFTVTKKGTIENVKLDRSSNYPEVDKKMIELITKAPGKWKPAENAKGEKVDQELIVSFGLMGC